MDEKALVELAHGLGDTLTNSNLCDLIIAIETNPEELINLLRSELDSSLNALRSL